ncbi:MAG: DUF4834 family protein [Bernardetiaceae bacterium]|nr:DUF4834 family protein [Bernardetiaceae bacterium]
MLKFLIIFGFILYVFYAFSGKILRFAMRMLGKRIEKKMKEQQMYYQPEQPPRKEGEIYVSYKPPKTKKQSDIDGEYVKFEEVK